MEGFFPDGEMKYIPIDYWKEIENEPKMYQELLEEAHKQYRTQLKELNATNNKLGEASQSWSKIDRKLKRAKRYQEELQEEILEANNVIKDMDAEIQYYRNQIAMEEERLQLGKASLSEFTSELQAQEKKVETMGAIAASVAEERLKQRINSIRELDGQISEEESNEELSSAASSQQDVFDTENFVKRCC